MTGRRGTIRSERQMNADGKPIDPHNFPKRVWYGAQKPHLIPRLSLLIEAGGRAWDRTRDPYHVKVVLYR